MNKKPAFTLIELMIVVAIIVLLASMAIPRVFKYRTKAMQAEVAMMLASLHTAEQAYWAEHNTYSTQLSGPESVGWEPEGYNGGKDVKFHYTYGFFFPGAKEGVHYFTGKLKTPPQSLGTCEANKEKFIARAAGTPLKNDKMDLWSIDEARNIKQEQDGIN